MQRKKLNSPPGSCPFCWMQDMPVFPKFLLHLKEASTFLCAWGGSFTPTRNKTSFMQWELRGCWKQNHVPPLFYTPAGAIIGRDDHWERIGEIPAFNSTPCRCSHPTQKISASFVEDSPRMEEWSSIFQQAQAAFERNDLEKVVLARRRHYRIPSPEQRENFPFELFKQTPSAYRFLVQWNPQSIFFGATPERLFFRKEEKIWVDAIAGTRRRSEKKVEEQELLQSPKDRKEFQKIVHFIEDRLTPHISAGSFSPLHLLKTEKLVHLHRIFEGTLKDPSRPETLIDLLAPTPAIAGFPQKESIDFLQQYEPFPRDYYAGTLSCYLPEETYSIVTIRSAFLRGENLWAYSGAGIIAESDCLNEWQELDHKLSPIESLLHQDALCL